MDKDENSLFVRKIKEELENAKMTFEQLEHQIEKLAENFSEEED